MTFLCQQGLPGNLMGLQAENCDMQLQEHPSRDKSTSKISFWELPASFNLNLV